MTTDPSSDVLERLRKRIERYETGLRVKSFEVGDNPVTDALAADLREVLATIERLSAELERVKGAAQAMLDAYDNQCFVHNERNNLDAALSNTAENG